MQSSRTKQTRWWIAGLLLLLCAPGCHGLPWQDDDKFQDDFADWGEKQRPAGPQGDIFTLSSRGQQVERNLGYR